MLKANSLLKYCCEYARITKLSCLLLLASFVANVTATPLESSAETIYILLSSNGGTTANPLENHSNTALKNYIQNNIPKKNSYQIYSSSIDLSEYTPAEYARKYLSRDSGMSIFDSAVDIWFNNLPTASAAGKWKSKQSKTNKTLAYLKSSRPDLLPSKFTVVADGAAGLAVREYIQSESYRGEISGSSKQCVSHFS